MTTMSIIVILLLYTNTSSIVLLSYISLIYAHLYHLSLTTNPAAYEGHRETQWYLTHPSSGDRYATLLQHVTDKNLAEIYALCQQTRSEYVYAMTMHKMLLDGMYKWLLVVYVMYTITCLYDVCNSVWGSTQCYLYDVS